MASYKRTIQGKVCWWVILKGPNTSLAQVSIKGRSQLKHTVHAVDIAYIPFADILTEDGCFLEHSVHVGHIRHIPETNVLIEPDLSSK